MKFYKIFSVMKLLVIISVLVMNSKLHADKFLPHMKISKTGAVELDGLNIRTIFFGKKWLGYRDQNWQIIKHYKGSPVIKSNSWKMEGEFLTSSSAFKIVETITKSSPDSVNYNVTLNSKGIEAEVIALGVGMKTDVFSGRKIVLDSSTIVLPPIFKNNVVCSKEVRKISIPSLSGITTFEAVKGSLCVLIQDDRAYNNKNYTLRIFFDKSKGMISNTSLNINIKYHPYKSDPISLSSVANMGFKDQHAGDKKGGWTDQGQNDLRQFNPEQNIFNGVTFDIPEADKNDGKSCVVLAGSDRNYFPGAVKVSGAGKKGKYLYLLHASAWSPSNKIPIGNIKLKFEDGSSQSIPIKSKIDVGDWWQPYPLPNASVAWTSENKKSYVGLYLSRFPISEKAIKSIRLESLKKAVWMIVGLSVGDDVPQANPHNYYIVKNSNWQPFNHAVSVIPGSILDFSDMLDSPAGKYGKVLIRNGQFEFADKPGEKQRFYGTNLCFSANYQSKEQTEKLVADLVRMGYNTIRIHHYDRELRNKNIKAADCLNPEMMGKLDYLFSLLKKNGIYIAIDLYTIRPSLPGEIKELNGKSLVLQEYKMYTALIDGVFENWKKFASKLLNHVNPYTGLKWKDDPALFNICLLNENNINAHWSTTFDSRKLYQKVFAGWLKRNKLHAKNEEERSKLFNKFTTEIQIKLFLKCHNFIKELGTKAHITDMNMQSYIPLQLVRDNMDYVDNHIYWDHPRYIGKNGRKTYAYKNRSSMLELASAPRTIMPTRIFGKPFALSEYNFCAPNRYRAESGLLIAAYAALQGWDVIHRFAYSHWFRNVLKPMAINRFDIVTDPINLLSDRIAVLMFISGNLKAASTKIPFVISKNSLDNPDAFKWAKGEFPKSYSKLGLLVKIGSVVLSDQKKLPASFKCAVGNESFPNSLLSGGKYFKASSNLYKQLEEKAFLPANLIDNEKGTFKSETGQIILNSRQKFFRTQSDFSEGFVINGKQQISGKQVTVKNNSDFAVVFLSSRDRQKLKNSKRILVFHLSDVRNSQACFKDSNHSILLKPGKLPHLVKRGSATITLKNIGADNLKVWPVDMRGKRGEEIRALKNGNTITFKAETIQKTGTFMIYEIGVK